MSVFNEKVTVYNHYKDAIHNDKWQKTVLDQCMWKKTVTKTVSDGRIQIDDSVSLTILNQDGYLPPKQFAKLEDKSEKWTLNPTNNLDIVVLGEIDVEITDDYTITNLRNDFDDVMTIKSVSDNTRRDHLKHWRVNGS